MKTCLHFFSSLFLCETIHAVVTLSQSSGYCTLVSTAKACPGNKSLTCVLRPSSPQLLPAPHGSSQLLTAPFISSRLLPAPPRPPSSPPAPPSSPQLPTGAAGSSRHTQRVRLICPFVCIPQSPSTSSSEATASPWDAAARAWCAASSWTSRHSVSSPLAGRSRWRLSRPVGVRCWCLRQNSAPLAQSFPNFLFFFFFKSSAIDKVCSVQLVHLFAASNDLFYLLQIDTLRNLSLSDFSQRPKQEYRKIQRVTFLSYS